MNTTTRGCEHDIVGPGVVIMLPGERATRFCGLACVSDFIGLIHRVNKHQQDRATVRLLREIYQEARGE